MKHEGTSSEHAFDGAFPDTDTLLTTCTYPGGHMAYKGVDMLEYTPMSQSYIVYIGQK